MAIQDWPLGDDTALVVLQTVADRNDLDRYFVDEWARGIGQERFEEILSDTDGYVAEFSTALNESREDDLDLDYDKHIGPAIDRVEDAYLADRP